LTDEKRAQKRPHFEPELLTSLEDKAALSAVARELAKLSDQERPDLTGGSNIGRVLAGLNDAERQALRTAGLVATAGGIKAQIEAAAGRLGEAAGLHRTGETVRQFLDAEAAIGPNLRTYPDIIADVKRTRDAAIARAPLLELHTEPLIPSVEVLVPSAEVQAMEAVAEETRSVNQAIVSLATLIANQGEIAERQEAGIIRVVGELEKSRISADNASRWLVRLTIPWSS
jgi:hypothetical protein